jgi:RNA polymerase-binding transcription factor DksA
MELEQLSARLEEELARIQEGFFGGTEQEIAGELSSIDQHPADSATITESREINLTVGQLLGTRRENVLRALEKIKNGTYGICDYGGEPIDPERLKVHPEAIYCLEHQRLIEQERRGEQRRRLGEGRESYWS